jgi:alanine racemase
MTKAYIHLDRLTHNLGILQKLVGNRPMWPAIKANAYGHGLEVVARHLLGIGYDTLCVAHVTEAAELIEAGVEARYLLLSATLPEHSEQIVELGCEPVLCTDKMIAALSREAKRQAKPVSVHLAVDTGMGRIGIGPEEVAAFVERAHVFPELRIRGLMSHFPCADMADKTLSRAQIARFKEVIEAARPYAIDSNHMANSAAIFDLPGSYFDAVRPGISIYGLRPSWEILNPMVDELQPVLEWKTQVTFLKEVPAGTGLSYGHSFYTERPSLIATVPVGYGDGLSRTLSNNLEMLVRGKRCPQVGRITMDQTLIDVTALRGRIDPGEEVVIIGRQGDEEVTADELAAKLGTINYEVVTAISRRVRRVAVEGEGSLSLPQD